MTIDQMRLFSTLCRVRNFTKAAAQLFISQEGLSYQIRQMEKELGYPLFIRNSKQVEMTPEGAKWHTTIDSILHSYDSTAILLADRRNDAANVLRISYFGYDYTAIFDLMSEFVKLRPDIRVQLITESSGNLAQLLLEMKSDVMFGGQDLFANNSLIDFVATGEYCNGFILHREHPLAGHDSLTWQDIRNETLILPSLLKSELFNTHRLDLERQLSAQCPGVRIVYAADHAACVTMVDLGTGILPTSFETRFIHKHVGRNCILIPRAPLTTGRTGFLYLKDNRRPVLQELLSFVRSYIGRSRPSGL